MTFHEQQLNSMTFQAWKLKYLNSMTFQVFHDPYEPWPRPSRPVWLHFQTGLMYIINARKEMWYISRNATTAKIAKYCRFNNLANLAKMTTSRNVTNKLKGKENEANEKPLVIFTVIDWTTGGELQNCKYRSFFLISYCWTVQFYEKAWVKATFI